MAQSPRRPCAKCGQFIRSGRCPTCYTKDARARDAARPNAAARGYGYEWTQFSQRWLSRYPFCGQRADGKSYAEHSRCVQEGNVRSFADTVDHIVAMKFGGKRFVSSNLQSLCQGCNLRKGIAHEGGFGHPIPPRDG